MVASAPQAHGTTSNGAAECHKNVVNYAEIPSSVTWSSSSLPPGKAVEPALLDERSLLACIVRAIPAGSDGRIRISTTVSIFSAVARDYFFIIWLIGLYLFHIPATK